MIKKQILKPHRWQILGAGAMGCLWAGRMALAGQSVQVLLNSLRALEAYNGLQIETSEQIESVRPRACLGTEFDEPIQNLLVCTKAWAVCDALEGVSVQLNRNANIVLMQNGMGFHEQIAARFPDCNIFCALTTEGAWTRQRFHVVHAGRGRTQVGAWRPDQTDREETLLGTLHAGPLEISRCADISLALWQKLIVNCAINPLTALYRIRNGELLAHPNASSELKALIMELEELLIATGHSKLATEADKLVKAVIQATASNFSSMRQDIEAGRRTEIDFMTGYLCDQAVKVGIDLPVNRGLYERVQAMTS